MTDFSPIVKALAIVPKISATLSMFGSGYIVQEIAKNEKKLGETYQRLVLALSICDLVSSFGAFLGTWPIPSDTVGVYGAVGTTQTCVAAGFFNQLFGPCQPMYGGALGIYYLVQIRYNWTKNRVKRAEMICHAIILTIGLGTSIAGLPLDLYNSADGWVCWIAEYPMGCKDSHRYGENATCIRGDNAWIYQWAWFTCLGWASFIIMTGCLTLVYMKVLKQERRIDKYDVTGERRRDNSNAIFWQGVLYCLAFMATWFFATLVRILLLATNSIHVSILFLNAIFWPLQGFWNFFIYLRPRYLRYRKKHPKGSFCHMTQTILMPNRDNALDSGVHNSGGGHTTASGDQSYEHS